MSLDQGAYLMRAMSPSPSPIFFFAAWVWYGKGEAPECVINV